MSLIFDAHLDLAMNAMEWNRDLTLPVKHIRESERLLYDKPDRGNGTVTLDAMRKGNVGICVATQIAKHMRSGSKFPGWNSAEQLRAQTQRQLAWYKSMERQAEMNQNKNKDN